MKNKLLLMIAVIALLLGSTPNLLRAGAAPSFSTGKIAASLQPFIDSHTLAGAVVLVASKDKVLDIETVGYADIAAKKPMAPENLFWIASMSKPMTATALMMLVDEGKVNVDDPVEKYLPEYQGQMVIAEEDADHVVLRKPVHPILVRNVLSHTSGLPFLSRVIHHIDQFPLSEAAITYAMSPLKFQPDSKYQYANAGIDTAGRIIEVVSGMPYEQFMAKRLFEPLGMKDTTFFPSQEQIERLAKSYKPNEDKTDLVETEITQLTYPLTSKNRYPSPAGGLFSTAGDVGTFCRMILAGGQFEGKRYVSEASVRQMTSTQTGDLVNKGKGENGYGFGWQTEHKLPKEGDTVRIGSFGHGGAYSTNMSIDLDHQLVFVYMVQHAKYAGKDGGKIHPTFMQAAIEAFAKLAG
jgi:CubicO group peptidase (beta-lactamase class C family)